MKRAIILISCVSCSLFGSPDQDADGFSIAKGDCDDLNQEIHPKADERCDEIDNDCDGRIDNNALDADTFYIDSDGDGFGSDDESEDACEAPDGFARNDDDCDDNDRDIHPDAEDTDGEDRNCDGEATPPGDDDDDDDDVTPPGPLTITEVDVSCSGTSVTFDLESDGPSGGALVFTMETGTLYPALWCDEHSLDVITTSVSFEHRSRTIADGSTLSDPIDDWQTDVSTVFNCASHYNSPGYLTYAFAIIDLYGSYADCVVAGGEPAGLVAGDYLSDCVGQLPSFDLSPCRVGTLAN